MKTLRTSAFHIGAITLLALFPGGCGDGAPAPAQTASAPVPAAVVEAVEVRPELVEVASDVVGVVEARVVARILSPGEGVVEMLAVREGDAVLAGQVVARISTAERVALLATTASRLDDVRGRLADVGIAANGRKDLEDELARAVSDSALAERLLLPLPVVSPVAGTVLEKPGEVGTVVSSRQPLLTVANLTRLVVRATVPELMVPKLRVGDRVQVRIHALPGTALSGVTTVVGPQVDLETRTAPLEVEVGTMGGRLRPGMLATVSVVTERREATLLVPDDAFVMRPGGRRVLYVIRDGTAAERTVRTGVAMAGRTEVVDGLQPGDSVIVAGHEGLKNGAAVRVTGSRPAGAAAAGGAR